MRKLAATYIFLFDTPPLKNSILILEDDGTILKIIDTRGKLDEQAGMEHYSGMLVPGIINKDNFEAYKKKQLLNPDLEFSELVRPETNGHPEKQNCTFRVGNKPGIYLISGMDLVNLKLLPSSKIKQLA